jgi:hypothetical protein
MIILINKRDLHQKDNSPDERHVVGLIQEKNY